MEIGDSREGSRKIRPKPIRSFVRQDGWFYFFVLEPSSAQVAHQPVKAVAILSTPRIGTTTRIHVAMGIVKGKTMMTSPTIPYRIRNVLPRFGSIFTLLLRVVDLQSRHIRHPLHTRPPRTRQARCVGQAPVASTAPRRKRCRTSRQALPGGSAVALAAPLIHDQEIHLRNGDTKVAQHVQRLSPVVRPVAAHVQQDMLQVE